MTLFETILTAVGLSMDAFAVAICKGLAIKKLRVRDALLVALFFGVFQGVMPVIGWAVGVRFKTLIDAFDHWIAFVLLILIGVKMLIDTAKGDEKSDSNAGADLSLKGLTVLAIATSIDALAVGVAMACLEDGGMSIFASAAVIGIITLLLCFCGVYIGHTFGSAFEKSAGFTGGVILILIGVKILLEHLGVLDRIFSAFSA